MPALLISELPWIGTLQSICHVSWRSSSDAKLQITTTSDDYISYIFQHVPLFQYPFICYSQLAHIRVFSGRFRDLQPQQQHIINCRYLQLPPISLGFAYGPGHGSNSLPLRKILEMHNPLPSSGICSWVMWTFDLPFQTECGLIDLTSYL